METLKKWLQVAVILLVSYGLFTFGCKLGVYLFTALLQSKDNFLYTVAVYGCFIGIWVLTIAYCLITKHNRKYFKYLGGQAKGNKFSTSLILGLSCGICLNLIVDFTAILHHDISLSFNEFNLPAILLLLLVIAIQSGAEELLSRWFNFRKICDIFPKSPWIAFVLSALGFVFPHLKNSGVSPLALFNIFLFGILLALIVYYYESFWGVVIAHTSWNFCQNVILGLPNSGFVMNSSIFKLDTTSQANSFAYNTAFGIEGTIMSTVIFAIACLIIWYLGSKKKAQENI